MSLNLRAAANAVTTAVNENTQGTLWASSGATIAPDGSRIPTFAAFPKVLFQIQALSAAEIRHLDSLNLQGIMRAVYFNGNIEGLDRPAGRGGDVLGFNNAYWLTTQVLETWDGSGWCKIAVTLQNGKPAGIP